MINQLTSKREKKADSSLDLSLSKENDDTDILTEGIESSRCVSILYDCLKILELKVI